METETEGLLTMAKECTAGNKKANVDFLEFAFNFVMEHQHATPDFCGEVASNFQSLAQHFSQVNLRTHDLIMRLYAITFSVDGLSCYSRGGGNSKIPKYEKGISVPELLTEVEKQLGSLTLAIDATHTGTYMPHYFNALSFFCEPLSVLIQSGCKGLICGFEDTPLIKLSNIQNVFQKFIDAYRKSEKEKFAYEDNIRVVLDVASAVFTLSLTTKKNFKANASFLEELANGKWVQARSLKYLYKPLNKVGKILYKAKRLKKAKVSYHLCCLAAWKYVMESEPSPDRMHAFIAKTCATSAILLKILYKCDAGGDEIDAILTTFLESWSAAKRNWAEEIPSPVDLVKQWVKILCEETKDPEDGHEVKTIYSLMSSSSLEKGTLGFLLEQEIEAYREVQSLNTKLCGIMQMRIFNILIEDIYITDDSFLQRSKILIAKAREHRAVGLEGLNDCISSLSDAISTMETYNKDKEADCDLLAKAYCLRALCTIEGLNSESFLQDIDSALKIWLNQEHFGSLILLYHVSDLLSLKGYMDFYLDIYELMIKFCINNGVSLEKCLANLWETRRLSHALCTSHVDDAFISTFSKYHVSSNSVEFWERCMENPESLKVGLQQCCSVHSTRSAATDHSHVTIDDVKKAILHLSKEVSPSRKTTYLLANLYYDLSERMFGSGSMIEALSHATEALTMRTRLCKQNFKLLSGQPYYNTKHFQLKPAVATKAWSNDKGSNKFDFILTPWNLLRCYLESILQVGTIHEIIGHVKKAKSSLIWGKHVSISQQLPVFSVSFSIVLGKIYAKQKCWSLADKEIRRAQDLLSNDSFNAMCCLKCKLILEVKVEQLLGDVYRSRTNDSERAIESYRSAVEKLMVPEWESCVSNPTEMISRNTVFCDIVGIDEEQEPTPNELKACGCETTCVYDEVNCWHCVPSGVMKSLSLKSVIAMKWECTRRRLLVKLFIEIGESLWACGETEKAHKEVSRSVSVLVNRNTFHPSNSQVTFTLLAELIKKNIIGDAFIVEHATLLYTICWLSLRNNSGRNCYGDMFNLPIPEVASGLKLSLVGCCEIPELFQKVSRLLAVLYTLSPCNETFSMPDSSSSGLSVSQWASYFHQASLGASVNCMLFSYCPWMQENQNVKDVDSPSPSSSTSVRLHRLVSESFPDLEEFILEFFRGLPRATIVCISILGEEYGSWLRDVSSCKSSNSWIMISRLNLDSAPVVIVLPIRPILAGNSDGEEKKGSDRQWERIDQIAPLFRSIMGKVRELYREGDSAEWWPHCQNLDQSVRDFVRNMEDAWLGSWKDLLLGGLSDHKHIDALQKKLKDNLKSKCSIDVPKDVIKAVTRSGLYREEGKGKKLERGDKSKINATKEVPRQRIASLSKLMMTGGCYIGVRECVYGGQVDDILSGTMLKIESEACVDREPVILVPDFDIHMLPWESMPVLRGREIYRMPSVACISYTCDKNRHFQEKEGEEDSSLFPVIDPLNAYYMLNPGADLPSIKESEVDWFRQHIKTGIAGATPGVDELTRVLKEHHVYIYVGHGSGTDYISASEITKLERCAATLLMGCDSALLSLEGPYMPSGIPLDYLFAGSPVVIGNLWPVTADIIHFTKKLLDWWIISTSGDCALCIQKLTHKLADTKKRQLKQSRGKKRRSTGNSVQVTDCKHRSRIGSFMGEARKACFLPYINGAAPVCYGVPTHICRKDSLQQT